MACPGGVRSVLARPGKWESEIEEAAASLGASRWQTFRRVLISAVSARPSRLRVSRFVAPAVESTVRLFSAGTPYRHGAPLLSRIRLEPYTRSATASVSACW